MTARIEAPSRVGPVKRVVFWMTRRRVRLVPEPMRVLARHHGIFRAHMGYEFWLDRARKVEPRLRELAMIKASSVAGCPW